MRDTDAATPISGYVTEPTVRVNVTMPRKLWEDFQGVAAAHYRSRSDHIRFLMAEAVSLHERTAGDRQ